jgi:hypothetical protein
MKIQRLSQDLKLSNSKRVSRVSALHFRVKEIPLTAFLHEAHLDESFFQLLIPRLTPVSLLESKLGLETVTQLPDGGKRPYPSSHL